MILPPPWDERRSPESDWEDITLTTYPPKHPPQCSVKETSDMQGTKYIIYDSAGEAIDSTRDPGKAGKLLKYWQDFLYGKK